MHAVPSPAPGTGAAGKQPSTAGYWIAAAVFVLGTVGAVVWFVVSIVNAVNLPNDYDRIPVPGERTVRLEEGEWVLYHEYRGATTGFAPDPEVVVTGPDGDEVPVRPITYEETYEIGGREGRAFGRFDAEVTGSYTIEVFGEPGGRGQQVAVGRFFDLSSVAGIVGSIIVGALAFLVALTVLIITLVRRSRWKKLSGPPAATPPPYGGAPAAAPYGAPVAPPPAPGAGTPPAPGWGPPGSPPVPPPPAPGSGPPASVPPPPAPGSGPPASVPPPPASSTGWAAPGDTAGEGGGDSGSGP
jgi:hypothetical protein